MQICPHVRRRQGDATECPRVLRLGARRNTRQAVGGDCWGGGGGGGGGGGLAKTCATLLPPRRRTEVISVPDG